MKEKLGGEHLDLEPSNSQRLQARYKQLIEENCPFVSPFGVNTDSPGDRQHQSGSHVDFVKVLSINKI